MARRRARQAGFTMVELLIVTLIIAVLMAVAMPLYLASVQKSEVTTCRSNMWSIAQAEQSYRARSPQHAYTTDLSLLGGDMGSEIQCPTGGSYAVTISDGTRTANNGAVVPAGGIVVECALSSHGVFAPGVDHD